MRLPKPLEAVILDMDGTLHDTEGVYHAALKKAVSAVGFSVTEGFVHSLIGIPGKETDEMLKAHLGPAFPFDAYDRLYDEYCEALLAEGVRLKPGATELLDLLEERALPVAIATSASRRAATLHLMRSGLAARIARVVTRDDVARGKPHPDVYFEAARRVGAAPEHCLAVEDSFNGIRAAHEAGMMAVMVPDVLTPTEEIRTLCVAVAPDLHAVRGLLFNA
ncbi:MAG TPA: HAD family phosphatase [Acetobacteraceae bacterium]|nr:HAD family phosphatase [Acetobacteraceae bacterium]